MPAADRLDPMTVAVPSDPTMPAFEELSGVARASDTGPGADGGTVFVFPGCGWPWPALQPEILAPGTAFSCWMHRCESAFAPHIDSSLLDVVRCDVGSSSIGGSGIEQLVHFAVTVSMAAQWHSEGIWEDAVLGHSSGEIAAACVAGAISLQDAANVLMVCQETQGKLAPAGLDASEPTEIADLRDALITRLGTLQPQPVDVEFISTVTGAGLDTSILDGEYWFANLRQPPLFGHAIRWALEHGYRKFVETSPIPLLDKSIQEIRNGSDG